MVSHIINKEIKMIENLKKENCTGCGACVISCPSKCIVMKSDEEGFLYPNVDKDKCIQCKKCIQKCHMRTNIEKSNLNNQYVYAACHKSPTIRMQSSSGGGFWAAVQVVIQKGGIVYGAVQKNVFKVRHMRAENLEECKQFRKSKYLESYLGKTYANIYNDLETGRIVLFSGTGCQVAGLYAYLGKDYDNLYTCDIICHGVPSPVYFKKYITELENILGQKICKVCFRDKKKGWNNNQITFTMENGYRLSCNSNKQLFHRGYLLGLYYRPACKVCHYAKLPRKGDISLADFWAYNGKLKRNNKNTGISLCVISSQKGEQIFKEMQTYLYFEEKDLYSAMKSCRHLTRVPKVHEDADEFKKLVKKKDINLILRKYKIN